MMPNNTGQAQSVSDSCQMSVSEPSTSGSVQYYKIARNRKETPSVPIYDSDSELDNDEVAQDWDNCFGDAGMVCDNESEDRKCVFLRETISSLTKRTNAPQLSATNGQKL